MTENKKQGNAFLLKMKEDRLYRRNVITGSLLAILLLATIIITVVGTKHEPVPYKPVTPGVTEDDRYYLSERTTAEFMPVIIEKFLEESELVVLTAETSQTIDLKQMGIFDWEVLNKTQTLTFKATGNFYIDLAMLGENSVRVENETKQVVIYIPYAKMAPAEIDPDKFEASEVQKGLFAMGDLKFTPQEYNTLEKEAKDRINKALNTEENLKKADKRAQEEVEKLFNPVVQAVDADYQVRIEFVNQL